jgi:hypothetical protein
VAPTRRSRKPPENGRRKPKTKAKPAPKAAPAAAPAKAEGRDDKGRFSEGNRAAVGYGRPKKDWDIETEAINWSVPIVTRFGMMGATARSPQDVAAGKAVLAYAHGMPRQRTELTGKDGKDLIPSRDDAIEALRAAVPGATIPPPAAPVEPADPGDKGEPGE